MMTELPEFYFRIRENGAAVFRVSTENRQRRIEMEEIAIVNIRNGNIRPHGDRTLGAEERAVIEEWIEERRAVLDDRDIDDIHRAVDHLNLTTQWAQSRASDADLEEVTDRLLLAMHDLRTVLVRKKADRMAAAAGAAPAQELQPLPDTGARAKA
ncbi:MAG: hypothetical protein N4A39_07385 [Roseicyclus sp.]|nr:hypothetical protein [Roseicyclus sp.]